MPPLSSAFHCSSTAQRQKLRESRLLRIRAFFDAYGAAVALGVLPRPGTVGERALLMLRGFGLRG